MKGILFKPYLIQAIIDGRKTITRRLMNPQPPKGVEPDSPLKQRDGSYSYLFTAAPLDQTDDPEHATPRICAWTAFPRYEPGEIVYVKETYAALDGRHVYRLARDESGIKWRSPLFMPAKAARLFIQIEQAHPRQVKEIILAGAKECEREGIMFTSFGNYQPTGKVTADGGKTWHDLKPQPHPGWHMQPVSSPSQCYHMPTICFGDAWDEIHASPGTRWHDNPWVWRYQFRALNEDEAKDTKATLCRHT